MTLILENVLQQCRDLLVDVAAVGDDPTVHVRHMTLEVRDVVFVELPFVGRSRDALCAPDQGGLVRGEWVGADGSFRRLRRPALQ